MILTIIEVATLLIFVGWPAVWGVYLMLNGDFNRHGSMEAFLWCILPYVYVYIAVTSVYWKLTGKE